MHLFLVSSISLICSYISGVICFSLLWWVGPYTPHLVVLLLVGSFEGDYIVLLFTFDVASALHSDSCHDFLVNEPVWFELFAVELDCVEERSGAHQHPGFDVFWGFVGCCPHWELLPYPSVAFDF